MRKYSRGMTLMEVLIAVFIFMIGIVGVLAAVPTGVGSAEWVIFQDAAIHLSRSKFAEFRRDRVDPGVDLVDGSPYMTNWQEPPNGSPDGFRNFASAPGKAYQYFDDITRYEWRVDQALLNEGVGAGVGSPAAPAGYNAPIHGGGSNINVRRVLLTIRQRGTSRELTFTQYMTAANRVAPVDPIP
ncbi:MAG TPA: prepilin-type N-terminal cleavage/methylation domain-containing protein [Planctomycetota bacterium]|nr:prepilin-type N-terminal cleavage/methylation domain-containing protein [Planctomycetota bacterium]